jgi:hypothetical protein
MEAAILAQDPALNAPRRGVALLARPPAGPVVVGPARSAVTDPPAPEPDVGPGGVAGRAGTGSSAARETATARRQQRLVMALVVVLVGVLILALVATIIATIVTARVVR